MIVSELIEYLKTLEPNMPILVENCAPIDGENYIEILEKRIIEEGYFIEDDDIFWHEYSKDDTGSKHCIIIR